MAAFVVVVVGGVLTAATGALALDSGTACPDLGSDAKLCVLESSRPDPDHYDGNVLLIELLARPIVAVSQHEAFDNGQYEWSNEGKADVSLLAALITFHQTGSMTTDSSSRSEGAAVEFIVPGYDPQRADVWHDGHENNGPAAEQWGATADTAFGEVGMRGALPGQCTIEYSIPSVGSSTEWCRFHPGPLPFLPRLPMPPV